MPYGMKVACYPLQPSPYTHHKVHQRHRQAAAWPCLPAWRSVTSIPDWIAWLHWLSLFYYAYNILTTNEVASLQMNLTVRCCGGLLACLCACSRLPAVARMELSQV